MFFGKATADLKLCIVYGLIIGGREEGRGRKNCLTSRCGNELGNQHTFCSRKPTQHGTATLWFLSFRPLLWKARDNKAVVSGWTCLPFFLGFKPKQSRKEKANGQLFLVHCFFTRIAVEQTRNQTTEGVSPFVAKR